MNFLNERTIQVMIRAELSNQHIVENGMPQGSVLSPTLLSIMISDISKNIAAGVGEPLFAHSLLCSCLGLCEIRGRNVEYVVKKMQERISSVEKWGTK